MPRYFIEVAYKGTHYSGFQRQDNANTIQTEVEKAFQTLHKRPVLLTGSSRTDAGVHALQNYFHFDDEEPINRQFIYKINAILPPDIVVKRLMQVHGEAHCRFDALSREYEYRLYRTKNPFLEGIATFYPYKLDIDSMHEAASIVKQQTSFFAFAKTNTQVKNFNCCIYKSEWVIRDDMFIYNVEANRFLRGMVRLLTASMLKVGRGQLSLEAFKNLFSNNEKCGFSVPAHGLFLKAVNFPLNYFPL